MIYIKGMPKISVIIPVYNAEKYIDDCIDSVLKQTFQDFELILIDDGSKDRSFEICKLWSNKDKRIKVFSQHNSGASAARNLGLDEAKGEWIVFVDSDDKVLSGYLSDLYEATQGNSEIVLCVDGISVYRNGQWEENKRFSNLICDVSDANKLFGDIQLHRYGFSVGKLYKKSIIDFETLRFDEKVCIAEDMFFMVNYLLAVYKRKGSKIAFVDKCNYEYYVHSGSLSTSSSSFEKEFYSYQEYKNIVIGKLKRSFVIDTKTEINISQPLAYYTDRCLNAIFHKPQSKDWMKQLSLLDRKEYQKYKNCDNLYEVILKFLFVHHYWRVFGFCRNLIAFF